jgi:hypothetical protein
LLDKVASVLDKVASVQANEPPTTISSTASGTAAILRGSRLLM